VTWAQTFTYDPFGNVTKTGSVSWQPGYDTNNRYTLGGTSYDANGNLKTDTFNSYTWNADATMASANSVTATYDALGRAAENTIGWQFIYGPGGGQALAIMSGQVLTAGFVPLPGGGFAVYQESGIRQYDHPDWLGSSRMYSTTSRSAIPAMAYAPFGEGYAGGQAWAQFTTVPDGWTVYDSENQTGTLVDFTFRHYNPTQGRFISPDPAGLAAVNPSDPQTWNRYAYVGNRPLAATDPSGLFCLEDDCGSGFGGGGGGDPNPCDFGDDPYCGSGPCDVIFDPFCGTPPGGGGGGGGGWGPTGPGGAPPQRTGGVWANNETLGLPTGLNVSPLGLGSLLGLSPGTGCGDFIQCSSLGPGSFSFTTPATPWPIAEPIPIPWWLVLEAGLAGILMSQTGDNAPPQDLGGDCTLFMGSSLPGGHTKCIYDCPGLGQLCSYRRNPGCPYTAMPGDLSPCDLE
jgi:RHS repeat-associated protein